MELKNRIFVVILLISTSGSGCHAMSWLRGSESGTLHEAIIARDKKRCEELLNSQENLIRTDERGNLPLHAAAKEGCEDFCQLLIFAGAEIDSTNAEKQTPLHLACQSGHYAVCVSLLNRGADIFSRDSLFFTPLHWAVLKDHLDVCELLIARNAEVNAFDVMNETALHLAFSTGNINYDVCKCLLSAGAKVTVKSKRGQTPLHLIPSLAVRAKAEQAVLISLYNLLVEAGARIDESDEMGNTPLHMATKLNCSWLCKIFLEANADPLYKNKQGKTPFDEALILEPSALTDLFQREIARRSESFTTNSSPLHLACLRENGSACQFFMQQSSFINQQNIHGLTPLMICCQRGSMELAQMLLSTGKVNPEVRDAILGGTALHFACKHSHPQLCRLLMDHGFNPNARIKDESLLLSAINEGTKELVELFIARQDDPNKRNKAQQTPLHVASKKGFQEIVNFLLINKQNYNIDCNSQDEFKKTPLHLAAEQGHVAVVLLLLTYESDPLMQDALGKYPLYYAALAKQEQVCLILKDRMPATVINVMKSELGRLVKGNPRLEELFGWYQQGFLIKKPFSSNSLEEEVIEELYDRVPQDPDQSGENLQRETTDSEDE
jgi:ankyrin repeat protein